MPMKRHFGTTIAVAPGAELVVTIGGETFVHRAKGSGVQVEISERITDSPEIGAPSLAQHAQTIAEMGLKTRG